MKQCSECGELIPPLSRICPYCLVNDTFLPEIQEFENPLHLLSLMRSMLDEYLESDLPTLFDFETVRMSEAIATFGCVRDVVVITHGKNPDVMDAVAVMEDLLYDVTQRRRKLYVRRRIIAIVLIISLICVLSALAYLKLRVG